MSLLIGGEGLQNLGTCSAAHTDASITTDAKQGFRMILENLHERLCFSLYTYIYVLIKQSIMLMFIVSLFIYIFFYFLLCLLCFIMYSLNFFNIKGEHEGCPPPPAYSGSSNVLDLSVYPPPTIFLLP